MLPAKSPERFRDCTRVSKVVERPRCGRGPALSPPPASVWGDGEKRDCGVSVADACVPLTSTARVDETTAGEARGARCPAWLPEMVLPVRIRPPLLPFVPDASGTASVAPGLADG